MPADDEVERPRGRRRGLAIGAAFAVGATVVGPTAAAEAAVVTAPTLGSGPRSAPSWPGLAAADSSGGVLEVEAAGSSGPVRGTALAMTADGIAVAPLHLVDGASSIHVTDPSSGLRSPASVLVSDPRADVAVLRIETTGLLEPATLVSRVEDA
ncbi:S1C family serine protease [Cellulomonas composti]|uniref:Uncharacterized protein n=1 Tax=Cellulomonas composti TaxID=266130 RepID=A0A511JBA8_9CELL|nr:S1C family serine protease [Cellulomonas composti]GEL95079.1 hypothetical protein CCO02nite_17370 [Cellulomonas composti]